LWSKNARRPEIKELRNVLHEKGPLHACAMLYKI
jgi:hypothetical protein